jgi:hypothetical protein
MTHVFPHALPPLMRPQGVDGRPAPYPTHPLQLTYKGDASKDPRTGALTFEAPPAAWRPWGKVDAAVGDLPVFGQLLGDPSGRTPFTGPAVRGGSFGGFLCVLTRCMGSVLLGVFWRESGGPGAAVPAG